MIMPTVGRIVWYWEGKAQRENSMEQPQAAMVTYVHSMQMINITTFDHHGNGRAMTSIPLIQPEDTYPDDGQFCEWMPYQIGKSEGAYAAENEPHQPRPAGD